MEAIAAGVPVPAPRLGADDLARLGALSATLIEAADTAEICPAELPDRVAEVFEADCAALLDADPDAREVRLRAGRLPSTRTPGAAVRGRVHSSALAAVESRAPVRFLSQQDHQAAGLCIPIQETGLVLCILRRSPLLDSDLEVLSLLVRQIGVVGRSTRQIAALARLGHELGLADVPDEADIYRSAADLLTELVQPDATAVVQIHSGVATIAAFRGLIREPAAERWRSRVTALPGHEALETGRPFSALDVREQAVQRVVRRGSLRATLAAPILVEGQPAAMLYAFRRVPVPFTDSDVHLATLLAAQVAAQLTTRRGLEQTQRRRDASERIRRFAESLAGLTDTQAVLQTCAETMLQVSGASRVTTLLAHDGTGHFIPVACHGELADEHLSELKEALPRVLPSETTSMAEALRTGRFVLRRIGVKADPSPTGVKYRLLAHGLHVGIQPLLMRGEAVGVALLEWFRHDVGSLAEHREELGRVANMSAATIHQFRLVEELRREREQLRALHDVSTSIVESADERAILNGILESVIALTDAQSAWITLLSERGDETRVTAVCGPAHVKVGQVSPLDVGISGWSMKTGRVTWVWDRLAGISDPPEAAAQMRLWVPGSSVTVPMRGRGGRILGCLSVHRPIPYGLNRHSGDILDRLATEAALALENSRQVAAREQLELRLRQQAYHDHLTGLPNREMLLDRLERCLKGASAASQVAVLYLDLDRFKTVNDSLGHSGGDALLTAVARRLLATLRPGDLLARLGGDEFVAVIDRLPGRAQAEAVARRLLHALADPVVVDADELHAPGSIGVALAASPDASAEELIRRADIAMYQVKAAGRGSYALYEATMGERAGERLSLENDLRRAISSGGLSVHYQPIVELATGRVAGFEALSRWTHPERGPVSPDKFIALAEDSSLIDKLDASVLATAAEEIRALQLRHGRPDLKLNVNLSASGLHETSLTGRISRILSEKGFDPAQLTLEITETAVMRDPERVLFCLTRLRELGVSVVMDDFGTGYSNMSYLKRFPLSGLKIDRSFVARLGLDPADEAIVRAVTTMSSALGLLVTAEGVETPEQARLLTKVDCRLAQGYLYAPALPVDELDAVLTGSRSRRQVRGAKAPMARPPACTTTRPAGAQPVPRAATAAPTTVTASGGRSTVPRCPEKDH